MDENASTDNRGRDQLEEWVDQYGNYLYRFALARVHSAHVAEDLVQETFLAALKGWARFEGRSSGKTWLTSILKHKIIDYIRKDVREKPSDNLEAVIDATDAMFTSKGHWAVAPKRWDINPEQVYEQKEFMSQLRDCLATMPARMARAFTLREMDGLSTREICDILDITESNSWVILYRARMALRRCLEVNWDIRGPGTTD